MPRSREELVEALREMAADPAWLSDHAGDVEFAALTEAADLLDSLEEREVEYRAAGTDGEGFAYASVAGARDPARRIAERLDLSLQRCTVLATPWTNVEEPSND